MRRTLCGVIRRKWAAVPVCCSSSAAWSEMHQCTFIMPTWNSCSQRIKDYYIQLGISSVSSCDLLLHYNTARKTTYKYVHVGAQTLLRTAPENLNTPLGALVNYLPISVGVTNLEAGRFFSQLWE